MVELNNSQKSSNKSDKHLVCMNCGKGKSKHATNYAGQPIQETDERYPGNASNDFLCIRCKKECEESVYKDLGVTKNKNIHASQNNGDLAEEDDGLKVFVLFNLGLVVGFVSGIMFTWPFITFATLMWFILNIITIIIGTVYEKASPAVFGMLHAIVLMLVGMVGCNMEKLESDDAGFANFVGFICIIWAFWITTSLDEKNKEKQNEAKIKELQVSYQTLESKFATECDAQGFHYKPEYSNLYDELMLGIAADESQILVSTHDFPINIKDILDIELSIDDSEIYKSDAEASLAGSAAGAYVFGDAGAVVGPLPTDIVGNAKISRVVLNLLMDDVDQPLIQIPFLEFKVDYFNSEAQNRIKLAEKWINIIEVMHHRVNKYDPL